MAGLQELVRLGHLILLQNQTPPPVPVHKKRGSKPKGQFKHTEAYLKKRGLLAKDDTKSFGLRKKKNWSPAARVAAAERCKKQFSKKAKVVLEKLIPEPRPVLYVPKVRKKMPANPKAFPEAAYTNRLPMFDAAPGATEDLKDGEYENAPE